MNVLEFGAKGDGITDDTIALQEAVKAHRRVLIPDTGAFYRTTKPIDLPSHTKVELQGTIKNFATRAFPDAITFTAGWMHPADYRLNDLYPIEPIAGPTVEVRLAHAEDAARFRPGDLFAVLLVHPEGDHVRKNDPASFIEYHRVHGSSDGRVYLGNTLEADVRLQDDVAWTPRAVYAAGEHVGYEGRCFISVMDGNTGNVPPMGCRDAFWSEQILAISKLDKGVSLGVRNKIVERVEIFGGGTVYSDILYWLARCAVVEGVFRNIHVERSAMLLGGNGFARCLFENIRGNFSHEWCEMAEGSHHTQVVRCHGTAITGANPLAAFPFNVTRPMEFNDCTIDTRNLPHSHGIRIGMYYPGYKSTQIDVEHCRFLLRSSANIIMPVGHGQFEFVRNKLNNSGQRANRLIFSGDQDNAMNDCLLANNEFAGLDLGISLMNIAGVRARITGNSFDGRNSEVRTARLRNSVVAGNVGLASAFTFRGRDASSRWA